MTANWTKVRIPFLAVLLGGVLFVGGKEVMAPSSHSSRAAVFQFPPEMPLAGWQPLGSEPLRGPGGEDSHLLAGRRYRYERKGVKLEIEMRFFVGTTGDVGNFLQHYTSLAPSLIRREQAGVGSYGVLATPDRAYLSACINPRAGSTLTKDEFNRVQEVRSGISRIWVAFWHPAANKPCLWAHFSMPLDRASAEAAWEILEPAWFSWYASWKPRFTTP